MFKKAFTGFALAGLVFGTLASDAGFSADNPYLPASRLNYESDSTTLIVDIGDPTANQPGDNLYAQIQEAVDAASAGDTIEVHAGTYLPFVVNTDNLIIRKANETSNPVIDGDLNPGDENGVKVNASGVTLRGLTVVNASGVNANGTGFLVTGDNNWLTENRAIDNYRGFQFAFNSGNTLERNMAIGNSQQAFLIDNSNDNSLTDNAASNNAFGFFLAFSENNLLSGNTASDNFYDGVFTYFSDGNTFESNITSGNGYKGFFFEFSDDNTLTDNTASDNGIGFHLEFSVDNTLTSNTSRESFHGFFTFSSDGNTFTDNQAFDNQEWGFYIDEILTNIFQGNVCWGNGLGGSNQPGVCE